MALTENIKKIQERLRKVKGQQGAGSGESTQRAIEMMGAASTGKALSSANPTRSSIGASQTASSVGFEQKMQAEQGAAQAAQLGNAAKAQTRAQGLAKDELAMRGDQASKDLAAQSIGAREGMANQADIFRSGLTRREAMQRAEMASKFDQQIENFTSQMNISRDEMFADFERSNKELAFREDGAELEQRAFMLAMADQEYLEEMQAIWAKRNLSNQINYRKELMRVQMGNEVNNLLEELGWKESFAKNERDFAMEMKQMNIDEALRVANEVIKQENTQAIISGVTNIAGEAASYDYGSPSNNRSVGTLTDNSPIVSSTPDESFGRQPTTSYRSPMQGDI